MGTLIYFFIPSDLSLFPAKLFLLRQNNESLSQTNNMDRETLLHWRAAYLAMCSDAIQMGIPVDAIPKVPLDPTAQDFQMELFEARDHLMGIISSFLSSGL